MWDLFLLVCAVVGMWTLTALVLGSAYVFVTRSVRRTTARAEGRLAPGAPAGIDRRARAWAELPEWITQDREWAAAVVILGSASMASRTEPYIDFAERSVDWTGLREGARAWDPDARHLVELAHDLGTAPQPVVDPSQDRSRV